MISPLKDAQDIFIWTVGLYVSMILSVVFALIPHAANLDDSSNISPVTYTAIAYLNNFFQLFAYIALIFLSKSRSWEHANAHTAYNNPGYVPVQPAQQQYASNGQPIQQYYYPQQPSHNGAPGPVGGTGYVQK